MLACFNRDFFFFTEVRTATDERLALSAFGFNSFIFKFVLDD